jgi:23S rRNA pseudouridine1911/1915/1917 synthase
MNAVTASQTRTFQLSSPVPDIRLDRYLSQALPQFSRAYLQRLIQQGHILVNDRMAKAGHRLDSDETITIGLPSLPVRPLAEPMPLVIVHEDEDILVLDKPAGLTVHPAPGHPHHTLVNAVLAHCPALALSDDLLRPGIVHRLDKDTSGLMIIAKNDRARAHLASQFRRRIVSKGYLVLVQGKLCPEKGIIEAPIGRDPRSRRKMTIVEDGKEATTRYQVREYLEDCTLLEVTPVTGRTHQIRVHLSAIGYPVAGDLVYGAGSARLERQFIHAYRLGFHLPSTGEFREFVSPLPVDLRQALERLRRS